MKTSNNIIVGVSAGLTSVMMSVKMKEWYPDCNIVNVFLNTSKEDVRSLKFMNECDKHYGLNLVYLESKINPKNKSGTTFTITSYEKLHKNGEVFVPGIMKYGIPSRVNKWCNRELKINPLKKYADSIFGKKNWSLAIGLRTDEIDRVSASYKTNNTFYPPIEHGIDEHERNKFWFHEKIKLELKSFEGNCDWCFEKSKRKLMTIAVNDPQVPIWWNKQEQRFSLIEIEGKPQYNEMVCNGGAHFGRLNESVEKIINDSKQPFSKATDEYIYETRLLDEESDCGNSCSIVI